MAILSRGIKHLHLYLVGSLFQMTSAENMAAGPREIVALFSTGESREKKNTPDMGTRGRWNSNSMNLS